MFILNMDSTGKFIASEALQGRGKGDGGCIKNIDEYIGPVFPLSERTMPYAM